MAEYQARMLAISLAGHDKGTCYIVLEQDEEWVGLVDGKKRSLSRPKKKNRKHIQLISQLPPELLRRMGAINDDTDARKILADYAKTRNQ